MSCHSKSGRFRSARLAARIIGAMFFLVATASVAVDATPDDQVAARKARINLTGGGATRVMARDLKEDQVGIPDAMKAVPETPGGDEEGGGKGLARAAAAAAGAAVARSSSSCPNCVTVSDEEDRSAHNVAIQNFDQSSENEPMVAANPRDPSKLVSGFHFYGDQNILCAAHYSRDGGKNWSPRPINMPMLTKDSSCSDSVIAYAPDGSRVYFQYIDIKFTSFDIVVSYSDDDGKTWTGPIVIMTAGSSADFDKPWIGTHVPTSGGGGDDGDDDGERQRNSKWVYATATKFDNTPPFACHIVFSRSSNKGLTWSPITILDSSLVGTTLGGCGSRVGTTTTFFPVVQGSRPGGGINNDVLATWYNSGPDGFLEGTFNIRSRYSPDNGATWQPIVVSQEFFFELSFWLGPRANYHRWWGGMFPSLAIAPNGSAHIGYSASPVVNPGGFGATSASGEIRYLTSPAPPYPAWSVPAKVNDDPLATHGHGWAAIGATSKRGVATVYMMWEDHRVATTGDNELYDVFWSKKVGNGAWSSNEKLTDVTSTSDFIFLGDYYGLTVVKDGSRDPFVYGVWTDRRDEPTIFHFDDDIWGARIPGKRMDDDD